MMRALLFFPLVALSLPASAAEMYHYRGTEYDLSVDIPKEGRICVAQPPGNDSGIMIQFDMNQPCLSEKGVAYIAINVFYNALEEKSAAEHAAWACKGAPIEKSNLRLDSLPLYKCLAPTEPGWVRVIYSAQKKTPKNDIDRWQNYEVDIKAPARELPTYERKMAAILKSARTKRQ